MTDRTQPLPVVALRAEKPYSPTRSLCPCDLRLDGNEGRTPDLDVAGLLAISGPDLLRRYPDRGALEARLALRHNLPPEGVLVTAGGDEAIDRICRAYLGPRRNLVATAPTFEMIPRYARLTGAAVHQVPWPAGAFPVEEVLARVNRETGVIAVVSPNNPTGAVATAGDLRRLAAAASGSVLMVDLAYGEFADEDLTPAALDLPGAVVVRSLSKAWGLAGLRVGYAAGKPDLLAPMRAAGGPYAVSGLSLAVAAAALDREGEMAAFTGRVRNERNQLTGLLNSLGAEALPSQGNFVLARFADPVWVRDGLAGLGIAARLFQEAPGPGPLRLTCPGHTADYDRLDSGLRTVLDPQALLFDMDGVLADVSGSYRQAIVATASDLGAPVSPADVAAAKRRPGSNNDWVLTRRLLQERGIEVPLEEVIASFQARYDQLAAGESLIPDADLLRRLARRLPLGIVTGRPRSEAAAFLERTGIAGLFSCLVCLEDGPDKPDPAVVRLALQQLGASRAWLVGDTVNDLQAARSAGVLPLGVVPPGEDDPDYPAFLQRAGAGRVLRDLNQLEELLP
jgi:histidinol-phosphate aminotransferase